MSEPIPEQPEDVDIDDVLEQLGDLKQKVDEDEEKVEVHRTIRMVEQLPFGKKVERYTTRDVAQSFVGSIIISLPLLVEDGVYDIGDHFLDVTLSGLPVFLIGNAVFIVLMTAGLLYWSDIRDVRVHRPLFGVIPRRLLGVLVISFFTATLAMTLWGRVENWQDPSVAVARISVIWAAAAFGAALGDILPGQASGTDINDVLRDIIGMERK